MKVFYIYYFIWITRFTCNFGCDGSNSTFFVSNERWDFVDSNDTINSKKDWNDAIVHANQMNIYEYAINITHFYVSFAVVLDAWCCCALV